MKEKLGWYFDRLRAMSPEEIATRTSLAIKKKIWQRRSRWISPQPNFHEIDLIERDTWNFPNLELEKINEAEKENLLREADRYLEGKYTLLNFDFVEPEIDWHLDPQTGKRPPLEFGPNLNYRDPSLAGNAKNIWEKNRHHHLTILALAYRLTKQEDYALAVEKQLQSWIKTNPVPLGINWSSSLELGVRLISWSWCDRLLRDSSVHTRLFGSQGLLWSSIYWHQWFIVQHYSQGSSANNHLIGEMAGLFITTYLWPVFPESTSWQSLSRKSLEQEVSRQTFESGLNREQAFSYQIFSLEFFLLAGLEAERLSDSFSPTYKDWVKRMLEIIPFVMDIGGNLPQYGDGDDGMALQLRPINSSRLDWLFHLGRQWLGAKVPLPSINCGLLTSRLICSSLQDEVVTVESPQGSVSLDDAGLFVLASQRGQEDEVFCLADAGCLGFLSIAAHGHADALSFTLSVGGVPIIVDPGTYIYHAEPQWRDYFRSTKAHNTIMVDGVDQSEPAGIFLWKQKAQAKVLSWEEKPEGAILLAEHDGYMRLKEGVVHRRSLALENKSLEIKDDIQGNGSHDLEWRIHFSPQCELSLKDNSCIVTWSEGRLEINLDSQLEWSLSRGEQEAGWYSSGFNRKQMSYTLSGLISANVPISFSNVVKIG